MVDRVKVWEKYGEHCAYCGCDISLEEMEVDHLIPKYKDGDDSDENLMPSCRSCNRWKKTFTLDEFKKELMLQLLRVPRDSAGYRMLVRYGLIEETGKPVKFYFET